MNRMYRVIWNTAQGLWQCVSETASTQGKGASGGLQRAQVLSSVPALRLLVMAAAVLASSLGAGAALAEEVNYPGQSLQTIGFFANAVGPTNAPGSQNNSANLSGNVVNMDAGGAQDPDYVFGATSDTNSVSNNTVNILGGTVNKGVFGGFAWSGPHDPGNATDNTVNISGGLIGGDDLLIGGMSRKGNASGNMVNISGGNIRSWIVSGAYVYTGSNAINNTIRISGAPVFAAYTALYGGHGYGSDHRTGNTLELHTKGITVANIHNFENLYFYLPADTIANGDTALTLRQRADISGSNVGVGMEGGGKPLVAGDKVTLIRADVGLTTDATNLANNTAGMQGISLLYDFDLSTTGTTLDATVTKMGVNPQTQSLLEGHLAALALANQGADLAAGAGITEAVETAQKGRMLFTVLSGGHNRYKTGSHIDQDSANLLLGVTTQHANQTGALTLGAFLEGGWGSYDSYNDFADMPGVRAHGHTDYAGAGILAQQTFSNRLYLQGSARLGRLKTRYHSDDLHDVLGNAASYSSRRSYASMHVGAGYAQPIGAQGDTLDLYGKLFWSRYGSDTQTILGDAFHFDRIESVRTRLGTRYAHPFSTEGSVYGGLAWEHEFRGVSKGQVFGLNLLEARLRGSSALLEAGLKFSPANNKALTMDVGLQGYVGKREGVSATAKLRYAF